jgi:hypothetical protein
MQLELAERGYLSLCARWFGPHPCLLNVDLVEHRQSGSASSLMASLFIYFFFKDDRTKVTLLSCRRIHEGPNFLEISVWFQYYSLISSSIILIHFVVNADSPMASILVRGSPLASVAFSQSSAQSKINGKHSFPKTQQRPWCVVFTSICPTFHDGKSLTSFAEATISEWLRQQANVLSSRIQSVDDLSGLIIRGLCIYCL